MYLGLKSAKCLCRMHNKMFKSSYSVTKFCILRISCNPIYCINSMIGAYIQSEMPHFRKFLDFRIFPKRGKLFFFFFLYYNMTISTQYSIKHRNNVCRNMWKYPLKYAPEHTIPHWKTKNLHTVRGRGDTPSHTLPPPPPLSLRSLAGGFQEIWNAPCGISDTILHCISEQA